ncbi:MAG: NUDIX domain-containing protein [Acidimicrobiia bacterium]|nr:NUDIX domain-containing protein [Acidimicrobiia bacterium]
MAEARLGGAEQERLRAEFAALAALGPAALDRSTRPAHLTASVVVVDQHELRLLVLHHTKLARWLQPGGHADGDTDLVAVATREMVEETGLVGAEVLVPAIHLDVHEVRPPREDPHLHFDVRFAAVAPSTALRANHESTAQRWVTPPELVALGADPGLLVAAARALDAVRDTTGR